MEKKTLLVASPGPKAENHGLIGKLLLKKNLKGYFGFL